MKISVDVKRLLLTTIVCIAAAILPLMVTTTESFYPFLVPLLFTFAITLSCFDRIITKRKYEAFVLNSLLIILLFFISIMFGFSFGNRIFGNYGMHIICLFSGLFSLLFFSITIKIDNLKLGLIFTGMLALSIPFVSKMLIGQKIQIIEFFGDPATFFIIWQTIIGLALAISIWTKTIKTNEQ